MKTSKLLVMGLVVCWAAWSSAEVLQIEGSTTVGPIADAFVNYFKGVNPDLEITVKQNGSGNGAAALNDGRCDIATMSRFMKPGEFKSAVEKGVMPVAHVVALDGVCIIVHPSNPIKELTTAQVRDIYTGKIKNWKELGGADMAIVPVTRDNASGTFETFETLVMNKQDMAGHVETVNTNPQAHARVSNTVGAIAYVGIGFLDSKVRALKIDGVMPSRRTIVSGEYPVARPLFFFTNGYPKMGSTIYKFCTFHLSEEGQEYVEAKGFIPVTSY